MYEYLQALRRRFFQEPGSDGIYSYEEEINQRIAQSNRRCNEWQNADHPVTAWYAREVGTDRGTVAKYYEEIRKELKRGY